MVENGTAVYSIGGLRDVFQAGTAQVITSGSIEGTYRALDEDNTWKTDAGETVMPYHKLTRDSIQPVKWGACRPFSVFVRLFNFYAKYR